MITMNWEFVDSPKMVVIVMIVRTKVAHMNAIVTRGMLRKPPLRGPQQNRRQRTKKAKDTI